MNILAETKKQIISHIYKITYAQRLTFGYIISKRLFSNYIVFYECEEFGKPDI